MPHWYHPGELEVQQRAGVGERAHRLSSSIHALVPESAKAFLEACRFLVLSTADENHRPWASVLWGSPGFAQVFDDRTVRIEAAPPVGDPLTMNLWTTGFVGLIATDFFTRRRLRINGRLVQDGEGRIRINADQVYANCPKYIQQREVSQTTVYALRRPAGLSTSLDSRQRAWIRRADTFFLATLNPGEGADASHRGGMPGFVKVDGQELTWPDYSGNSMFNSLGNINEHPWAGVVVPDFGTGSTLQLTGRATIDWNSKRAAAVPGAERLIRLSVENVVEMRGVFPTGLRLAEYSPFNPANEMLGSEAGSTPV